MVHFRNNIDSHGLTVRRLDFGKVATIKARIRIYDK